jgi:hypothetical protein
MSERDELIELIREALNANGYVVDRGYVAMADIRDAADAVLAGGWRKVEPNDTGCHSFAISTHDAPPPATMRADGSSL